MTQSTLIEIADKVVEDLNQSSVQDAFGGAGGFEAKRVYVPRVTQEEAAKKLHVLVVASALTFVQISRGDTAKIPVVQVGFIQGVPADDSFVWLDDLMLLMENAADYLRGKAYTLADGDQAFCDAADIPLAYDQKELEEGKNFRSFINLTFRRDG